MSASTHMEIAGIHFAVRCRQAYVLPDPWPCYRSFESTAESATGPITVDLDIEIGGMPDVSRMKPLFDGQSWLFYEYLDGFCISLAPRARGVPPVWLACFDKSFTKGIVYCDEMLVKDNEGARAIVNPIVHRLDQLLTMYILAHREGVVVHSTGVALDGRGYLFAGRSGAGKSTLARQLRAASGYDFDLLSDDRVVVRRVDGRILIYGTPWAGDAQIGRNGSAPLNGVFFLHHGDTNRVEDLDTRQAVERILPLASVPWYDRSMIEAITSFCETLLRGVPVRDIHFRPEPGVGAFIAEVVRHDRQGA